MLQRDLGKRISRLNLIDFLLRLLIHHLLHRFFKGRELLLHQISLHHFHGIRKFQLHQSVIQILKILRGSRFNLREYLLKESPQAGALRYIIRRNLFRPPDGCGQHVQLSSRVHIQFNGVLVLRIVFIQTGIQKGEHLVTGAQVDGIFIDFNRIGPLQCVKNTAFQNPLHIFPDGILPVQAAEQHTLAFQLQFSLRENHPVTV